jgi:hypothetical protein
MVGGESLVAAVNNFFFSERRVRGRVLLNSQGRVVGGAL